MPQPPLVPSRDATELGVAAAGAAAVGVGIAVQPVAGVVLAAGLAAALGLHAAQLSWRAGALIGLVLGHTVSGQLYVTGRLPGSFALVLDALALALVAAALLGHPRSGGASQVLLIVFIGLCAVEMLNPLVPSIGYAALGFRQLALAALIIFAVRSTPLTRREVRWILATLVLGWSVNVLLAGRQWLVGFSGAELRWIQDLGSTYLVGDQIRLLGATQSNQDFAFLAAVSVPAVAAFAFRATHGRALVLGAVALASIAVLFGSLVRSGLVGGALGVTVALAASAARPRERRRLLVVGIAAAGALWIAAGVAPQALLPADKAQTLTQRVTSIFSPTQDFAFRERQQASWPNAIRQMELHPFGAGPGSAGPLSQTHADEAPLGSIVPDNGYLLIGVQLGLLGLVVFVALLATMLRDLWRRARAGSAVAAAAAGSLAAAMTAMLAGNYWSLIAPSAVLAILVGLGLRDDAPADPASP